MTPDPELLSDRQREALTKAIEDALHASGCAFIVRESKFLIRIEGRGQRLIEVRDRVTEWKCGRGSADARGDLALVRQGG